MTKAEMNKKKLAKAKKIKERCDMINYTPARWVTRMLKEEKK